ncbi:hypothetical protein [Streptomyces sp. CBG30]|uniref:hypothetical protein n=1 Tax=Streptomyces sp. CBG30 TaxID=2838869 RepID=UPI0035B00437
MINRLGRVRAGLSIRFLLRQLMVILLLARLDLSEGPLFYTAAACIPDLFFGLQIPHGALTTLIRLRRTMPVITRNVDLNAVRITDAPPRVLMRRSGEKMLHLDIPAMAGLLIAAGTGENAAAYAGAALTLLLALLYVAALAPLPAPQPAGAPARRRAQGRRHLAERVPARPSVLYFSGSNESAYQGNMWLETMARIEGRPLIIMRERGLVPQLAETSVPVSASVRAPT